MFSGAAIPRCPQKIRAHSGEEMGPYTRWLPFVYEVRTFLIESQYAELPDFALAA